MSSAKIFGIAGIVLTSFLSLKNYAQINDPCNMVEGKYKICFEEKPYFNSFFEKEFIDSLRAHKGKPFNFNGIKFDKNQAILNPATMDFVEVYSFKIIESEQSSVSLYVGGYDVVSNNAVKDAKKGTVIYGASSSNEDVNGSLSLLKEKGIIQKQLNERLE